jgi:hypothetical protein
MSLDHDVIEELLAAESLDGLDETGREHLTRERATHGDCEECRRLERDFRETAAAMAFSLAPVAIDPSMAEVILTAGRADAPAAPPPTPVVTMVSSDAAGGPRERRPSMSRRWTAGLAAAAALLVLAVGVDAYLGRGSATTGRLAASGQRVVRFTPGKGVSGSLVMAYTPGQAGVVFWGKDLPDPGQGEVYEIWMISGNAKVSGGCVSPANGRIAAFVDADVGTADVMAVTAEPSSCPSSPSGDPLLTAPLSA